MFADLVLTNGKIVTVDPKDRIVEAVAVKFGRILATGSNADIKPLIGDGTKNIDLKGRTVIPGLNDTHSHIASSVAIGKAMGVIDASYEAGVKSISDLQARIREQAAKTPKGEWITAEKLDESKLAEKRLPNRWDLDKATTDHPVMAIMVGHHFFMVNSKALENAGVTKDTPDPKVGQLTREGTKLTVDGRYDRDPNTGELTGLLYEGAHQIVQPTAFGRKPTLAEIKEGIRVTLEYCLSVGLTCINDALQDPITIRALTEMAREGQLPLRVRMEPFYNVMPQLLDSGIVYTFGDDMVKFNAIKIAIDGAVSARTAYVSKPYLHRSDYRGELNISKEELREIVTKGYSNGERFSIHANGDVAIAIALDVYEECQRKYPRKDPRNRIVHCSLVNPELVKRIKELGVLPTIFGSYAHYHGDKILPAFGADRLEWMFAAKSFLEAGVRVAAHSDAEASPIPPLMGIQSLSTRRSAKGQPIGMSQKISVLDAIKLYTINAAYHSFEENLMGSIEPGKYADLVVLGEDILSIAPEDIMKIPVDMTVVGGKMAYSRVNV